MHRNSLNMKNKLRFIVLGLMIGLVGCTVQSKLMRQYKGKSEKELVLGLGNPTKTEKVEGNQKVDIYVKKKALKAAMINTGSFQYDRFESPRSVKTETYTFYLNSSGVVENVTYDIRYER